MPPSADRTIPAIGPLHWVLLTLILVAALGVRLWHIGEASFWGDEFLSASVSSGYGYEHRDLPTDRLLPPQPDPFEIAGTSSWSNTWDALERSTHPPLYFLLLRAWRVFGHFDDDASLRTLAALFSLMSVAVAFDTVRILQRSVGAALWAAAVLGAANVQIQFAQETRGYSLLCLFMLLACNAIVRIERLGINRLRLIGLIAAAAGMLLTHYLAAVICLLLAIYAAMQLSKTSRKQVWLALLCAVMFALAVWAPSLVVQMASTRQRLGWLVQQPDAHTWVTCQRLLAWPISALINPGWRPGGECYGAVILLLLPLLLVRKHPSLRLWTLLSVGELSIVAMSDFVGQTAALNFPRYTLPAATAAAILVPLIMLELPGRRWIGHAAAAMIVLACIGGMPLSYQRNKPNYREFAQFIDQHCRGDAAIVFKTDEPGGEPAMLMLELSRYLQTAHRPILIVTSRSGPLGLSRLPSSGAVDLVTDTLSAETLVPGGTVMEASFFPGIGSCTRVQLPSAASLQAQATFASP